MLKEFASFLIANGIATALKTDVFLQKRPLTPNQVITLIEYGGGAGQLFVGSMDRKIQITVRGTVSYAEAKAFAIYKLILNQTEAIVYLTGGERFAIMSLLDTPRKIGEEEDGTSIFGFNLGITTQPD